MQDLSRTTCEHTHEYVNLNECALVPYKQNSDNRAQISDYKCLKINEMKGK